jgi:hypothetical protein
VEDMEQPLQGGGIALVCEEGHIKADDVRVQTRVKTTDEKGAAFTLRPSRFSSCINFPSL